MDLDENSKRIVESLPGRTIAEVKWFDGDNSGGSQSGFTLHLDDGRFIEVEAWGHSWWGVTVTES